VLPMHMILEHLLFHKRERCLTTELTQAGPTAHNKLTDSRPGFASGDLVRHQR
jgi:hypothetical protein